MNNAWGLPKGGKGAGWRWTKGEKFETAVIAINNKTQKNPTNYAIKNTDRNLT